MKRLLFFTLAAMLAMAVSACTDNDDGHVHTHGDGDFQYQVHIDQPTTDDKQVGDMLAIKVHFESEAEKTVHHVKVRIYNKATEEEIYSQPDNAHVHQENGLYTFEDELMLNSDSGVAANSDWVLEAKVWGHEAGIEETMKTVEFYVDPN